MEEAQKIFDFLPSKTAEADYLNFLWDAFEVNYKNEKYQFAYIAYHMLFMCFVYYQIAKIYKVAPNCCRDLMLFTGKVQNHIEAHEFKMNSGADSNILPLRFSEENERSVMGLFLSVKCSREEIKRFKAIVDSRNEIAHSNGNIFYKSKGSLDEKIKEILSCIVIIQSKSSSIIESAYFSFLDGNANLEEREFPDDESQLKEIFIRGNFLSLEDVRIAQKGDISSLSGVPGYANIQALAETLKREYPVEE